MQQKLLQQVPSPWPNLDLREVSLKKSIQPTAVLWHWQTKTKAAETVKKPKHTKQENQTNTSPVASNKICPGSDDHGLL